MNVIESSRPRTASEGHATVGKDRGRTSLCPFGVGHLTKPPRTLRLGFDWIRSASWPVKWVFDPFLDERDRIVTTTHGLGGPCYGWKKPGTHLIMPLGGGGIDPSPHKDAAYGLEQVSGSVRCRGAPKFDRNRPGSAHKDESRRTSLFPEGFESSCSPVFHSVQLVRSIDRHFHRRF
jgi:hypothetical protein